MMDAAAITTLIGLILQAVQGAIQAGKSIREALADSLEEAAAKIRAGELGIDDAVARARDDQDAIDGLLRKRGGG